ncbi:MAG: GYF domain-containing protein, partial [Flavisolibacter sp.]
MERVYLLLRNNQQTGPFTIGELLQQQLKSSDMIWIEGKSAAWTYLSELELTPFIHHDETSNQQVQLKKEDEIERKAEEL